MKRWSQTKIAQDLEKLMVNGAEPTPYELRAKYGYQYLSEFFPVLYAIQNSTADLKEFVMSIFGRVTDPRDLNFRFGECHCPACHD